jgi:hypothetical protein
MVRLQFICRMGERVPAFCERIRFRRVGLQDALHLVMSFMDLEGVFVQCSKIHDISHKLICAAKSWSEHDPLALFSVPLGASYSPPIADQGMTIEMANDNIHGQLVVCSNMPSDLWVGQCPYQCFGVVSTSSSRSPLFTNFRLLNFRS